jgi:hypothetical protein
MRSSENLFLLTTKPREAEGWGLSQYSRHEAADFLEGVTMISFDTYTYLVAVGF